MVEIIFLDGSKQKAKFATDHAASSYGMPVLVTEDGTAYGPGDIMGCRIEGKIPESVRKHAVWSRYLS